LNDNLKHGGSSSVQPPDSETRLELYRLMQACRMMEQRAHELFMQNLVKGTTHLALGQEAVAAGLGSLGN
jgi:pyruvate dehydrogenase E1 component alpha subunit